jgi:hypothetical protein
VEFLGCEASSSHPLWQYQKDTVLLGPVEFEMLSASVDGGMVPSTHDVCIWPGCPATGMTINGAFITATDGSQRACARHRAVSSGAEFGDGPYLRECPADEAHPAAEVAGGVAGKHVDRSDADDGVGMIATTAEGPKGTLGGESVFLPGGMERALAMGAGSMAAVTFHSMEHWSTYTLPPVGAELRALRKQLREEQAAAVARFSVVVQASKHHMRTQRDLHAAHAAGFPATGFNNDQQHILVECGIFPAGADYKKRYPSGFGVRSPMTKRAVGTGISLEQAIAAQHKLREAMPRMRAVA